MALVCLLGAAMPARAAPAAEVFFCWQGAGGYSMTGRMAFPGALATANRLPASALTAFEITGYLDGTRIGHWSLADKTDETTFNLNYSPIRGAFLTGGNWPGPESQGWNANGEVTDCGRGGFGFNSGNFAQDLCVDGRWISDSSIDPATPLTALSQPPGPDCRREQQLSALMAPGQAG